MGEGRHDITVQCDHRHLECEDDQRPEAVAESIGDRKWRRAIEHCRRRYDYNDEGNEDIGVRIPTFGPRGEAQSDPSE